MDPLLLPQRGGDDDIKTLSDDDDEEEEEETWNLRVKSLRDVSVGVRPHRDTIRVVKDAVRRALGPDLTRDRPYTRLVCRGRLLAPDAALVRDLTVVQPDAVVHAVLSAHAPREGPQAALQRGYSDDDDHRDVTADDDNASSHHSVTTTTTTPVRHGGRRHGRHRATTTTAATGPSRRAWRGAGINAAGLAVRRTADSDDDGNSDDDDDDSVEDVENGGWMGLDRLRRAGLRRSDVTALRTYFGRSIDRYIRQHPEQLAFADQQDPQRRRLLQEDAWIQAQGPMSEFRLNVNPLATAAATQGGPAATASSSSWAAAVAGGNAATTAARNNNNGVSPSEAIWRSGGLSAAVGTDRDFIWGFLLGFLVGLLMLVWVWMPSVPHKQKLGILTGISFQLAITMLRTSGDVEDSNNDGNNNNNAYPFYEGDDLFFHD